MSLLGVLARQLATEPGLGLEAVSCERDTSAGELVFSRARSQTTDGAPAAGWAATVVRLLDQTAPGNWASIRAGGHCGEVAPARAGRGGAPFRPRRASGRGNPTPRSRCGVPGHPWRVPGRLGAVRTRLPH